MMTVVWISYNIIKLNNALQIKNHDWKIIEKNIAHETIQRFLGSVTIRMLSTIKVLGIQTDRYEIRLLQKAQSDQNLHCLQFPVNSFDSSLYGNLHYSNF